MVKDNLHLIRQQIADAIQTYHRQPDSVALLAVSKTKSAALIREAYQAGQHAFGENYVQEALEKIAQLQDLNITWHFIGPIQANKTRKIAEHFDWVQSVDRLKIAERLNAQRPKNLAPLNVCIEVNISEETSKSGVLPAAVTELAGALQALKNIRLRGLMAIPKFALEFEEQLHQFQQLHALYEQLNQQGVELDTLSMGMTADFPAAIAAGSTMVRVGTAIFGVRQ